MLFFGYIGTFRILLGRTTLYKEVNAMKIDTYNEFNGRVVERVEVEIDEWNEVAVVYFEDGSKMTLEPRIASRDDYEVTMNVSDN